MRSASVLMLASFAALSPSLSLAQLRDLERSGIVRIHSAAVPQVVIRVPFANVPLSLETNEYAYIYEAVAARQQASGRKIPLWLAPIFSAILPGSGQLHLGQDRFAGYAAVEAYGWIRYLRHRADGRRARNGYRTMAADVARSVFSVERPVGDFEYYEQMTHFIESGVFDVSDAPGVQPELDESTFNGDLWRRARDTFWGDPNEQPALNSDEYLRSVDFYERRAVAQQFRWSWRNAQLEHDLFGRTIAASNDDFRRSVTDFGVILGNHILSMVDAFVALRLRAAAGAEDGSYSISARIPVRSPAP